MVDRDRILTKLDELDGYLRELRTLLVHEYARIDDRIVFETVRDRLGDFDDFKKEILTALRRL